MPTHQYTMYQIAVWILHWTVQHLRYHMPYIEPWAENAGPPVWWYHFYSEWDWWRLIGPGNIPYRVLIDMALRGSWRLIGLWVDEVGDWVASEARVYVRAITGYLAHGYVTFYQWCEALRDRVGTFVPYFADSIAAATVWLYLLLPGDIRDSAVSWYDKFVAWYNASNSWAAVQFDAAKTWVANIAPDLVTGYNTVRTWYDTVRFWVSGFYDDPYGKIVGYLGPAWDWLKDFRYYYYAWITGWLGSPWDKLMAFTGGALTFFYNLYALYAAEIGAFWSDPLMWLYDRAEDELVRRW